MFLQHCSVLSSNPYSTSAILIQSTTGDVIKWYESSSSRKFWHSLQDNFSDRFENALTNLHRLSQLVMRAAVSGQGAELRVTRLAVEDVNEDVRAGLSGIARENAEIRLTQDRIMLGLKHLANPETLQRKNTQLWHQVGLSGTALLLGQKENEDSKKIEAQVAITSGAFQVATKASDQQLSSEYLEDEPSETQFTIYEIGQLMEPLLNILTQGVRVVDTNFPSPMAFDNRVSIALERWTLSQKSTILYLEFSGMSIGRHSPQMTAAACKIVNSAAQLSIPVISFFCNHPTSVPQPADHHTSQPENILGLIYSLAFQLSQIIPPLTKTTLHLSLTQLTALDLSPTSWTLALHVLARLLEHSPPLLLCVIDSFHQLDMSPTSSTHTHELLCVLQNAMKTEGKVFKILFTDSKRGRSLISEIPLESREIIEGERRSGTGRGVGRAPAGRGFIEFGF